MQFLVDLVQRVKGPAAVATRALRGLQKTLKSMTGAAGARLSNFSKGIRGTFAPFASMGKAAGKAITPIANFAKTVGVGAGVVGALGAAGVAYVADALMFREQAMAALTAFTGTPEKARQVYERVLDMAKFFGVSAKDSLGGVQDLMGAGFKAEEAMTIFQGALDLKRLKGADTKALTTILGQIKSKGKLQTEELLQLAESGGLAMGKVMEAIGEARGINMALPEGVAQVQKLLESGKVTAEEAIPAVLKSITKLTGTKAVGEFAAKGKKSLGGLWEALKAAPEQFLLRMDVSDGPAKKALESLLNALDPTTESGKKLMATLEKTAVSVVALIASFGTPENIEKFVSGLTEIIKAAPAIISFFGTLARWTGTVIVAFATFGDNVRFLWNELVSATGWVGWLGAALMLLAAPIVGIGLLLWKLVTAVWEIGTAIVVGLWNGIKAGWAWMIKQFNGLIDLLPAAVKKALGIASPSKVMMQLGKFTMQGFNLGAAKEAANSNGLVAGVMGTGGPSVAPTVTASTASSKGGARGPVSVSITVQIIVQGGAGGADLEAIGAAAGSGAKDGVLQALEQLGIEEGLLATGSD